MSKVHLYACSVRYRTEDNEDVVKQSVFSLLAESQEIAKRDAKQYTADKVYDETSEEVSEWLTVRAQAIPDELIAEAAGHVAARMEAQGITPITDAERAELKAMESKPPRPRSILDLPTSGKWVYNPTPNRP